MSLLREKMLIQQLDDTKQRSMQLEKTAKWWSECTVRWREKWGRVKTQRDKLHEEVQSLQGRNKALIVEYTKLRDENEKLRFYCYSGEKQDEKQVARVEPILEQYAKIPNGHIEGDSEQLSNLEKLFEVVQLSEETNETPSSPAKPKLATLLPEEFKTLENVLDNLELTDQPWIDKETGHTKKIDQETYTILHEKLTRVKSYLVECDHFVKDTQQENEDLKTKLANHRESETNGTSISENFVPPLTNGTSSIDPELRYLRTEIQRLQEENCKEWTLREERETELSNVNRELKQAQQAITELHDEIKRKELSRAEVICSKVLNKELDKKSLELIELKSSLNKIRKVLDEKIEENFHEKKRNGQYENEVKKLRTKINRLKKDLSTAEEKVDFQISQNRRFQRSVDELLQQNENLQLQLKQTSSRLKYQT